MSPDVDASPALVDQGPGVPGWLDVDVEWTLIVDFTPAGLPIWMGEESDPHWFGEE